MNPAYDELSTFDFWKLESELGEQLEALGFGLINCDLTYLDGVLTPCIRCDTKKAEALKGFIEDLGFSVKCEQCLDKKRYSCLFIKDTYPVELLHVLQDKEVIV